MDALAWAVSFFFYSQLLGRQEGLKKKKKRDIGYYLLNAVQGQNTISFQLIAETLPNDFLS